MLKIYSVEEAKRTILQRTNFLEPALPAGIKASIQAMFGEDLSADEVVRRILADVRQGGDDALRAWTKQIDNVLLDELRIPEAMLTQALADTPPDLVGALQVAADRIREFHSYQPLSDWTTTAMGGRLGQRVTPIQRVGIYVPGGTAPLPSSLLMSVILAQVAGVEEIVVVTPPGRDSGYPSPTTLTAAKIAGVTEMYRLGGAQAIAALAFGTETIPRVDKIYGPGNIFVTLAKRQVYGLVGVDGLYGPTETLVIADETANPAWVAADLLAQAEHDALATAILLTPSPTLASAVQAEVRCQLATLSRAETIELALANQGGIVLTNDLAEAACLADGFAAEHLCLAVADPAGLARQINNAGGLFLGEQSFEVLGDYVAGPSHTMPTSGTARFASPLNLLDFVKINSIIELDSTTAQRLSPTATRIAQAEGLTAHANAAVVRQQLPGTLEVPGRSL